MAAALHYRHLFDKSPVSKPCEYLRQFDTENTNVVHVHWKGGVVAARDLLEKRVIFTAAHSTNNAFSDVSEDTIYAWASSIPDEVAPISDSGVVRVHRLFGFNVVGHVSDLPAHRRG
jgi:hypothetical protein